MSATRKDKYMPLRRGVNAIPVVLDTQTFTCEVCGTVTDPAHTFCIYVEYPMPGPLIHGQRCQCVQHFTCSHQHAVIAAISCIIFHLHEDVSYDSTAPKTPVAEQSILQQARTLLNKYAGTKGVG